MADLEKTKSLKNQIEKLGGNLIAVSKKFSIKDIAKVTSEGIEDFGENYVSEAIEKIEALKELNIRWHFIGRVQSGNLNKIINHFYLIHSVTKLSHLKKINEKSNAKQKVLLQLQHEKDDRGSGLNEKELFDLLKQAVDFEKIELTGLMFMPPANFTGAELNDAFVWASTVFRSVKNKMPNLDSWDTLSMGMSGDFEQALKAGSTHVRIGTAIFGKRS